MGLSYESRCYINKQRHFGPRCQTIAVCRMQVAGDDQMAIAWPDRHDVSSATELVQSMWDYALIFEVTGLGLLLETSAVPSPLAAPRRCR
jgi:hypothetical protein